MVHPLLRYSDDFNTKVRVTKGKMTNKLVAKLCIHPKMMNYQDLRCNKLHKMLY